LTEVDSIVGWVEATKPNKTRYLCWAVPERQSKGFAIALPNLQIPITLFYL